MRGVTGISSLPVAGIRQVLGRGRGRRRDFLGGLPLGEPRPAGAGCPQGKKIARPTGATGSPQKAHDLGSAENQHPNPWGTVEVE